MCFKAHVGKIRPDNPGYVLTYRFCGLNGREVWLEEAARGEFDATGKLLRINGLTRDITERKKAELALAERSMQLALAGKAALVGSFAYDVETEMLQISAGYAAIHGFPDGTTEIKRSDWQAGVHPEDRAAVITGHTAEAWAAAQQQPQIALTEAPSGADCIELAKLILVTPRRPAALVSNNPAWAPWGVQLAGNWSEGRLLATYEQLRRRYHSILGDYQPLVLRTSHGLRGAAKYIVRVSEKSRVSADALCTKLRATGGACVVLRNPST